MPEVTYKTTMNLPVETIWDFVKDMNNWAPFLTGYQKHQIIDDVDSIWTLKGDVGVLSRVVHLKAHITEWSGPERVSFTLTGMNEEVEGGGELVMSPYDGPALEEPKRSLIQRLFRWLMRLIHGKGPTRQALPAGEGGGPTSLLVFTLRMDAGGAMGPLVNSMLEPALYPAAEDLANKIAAHLEQQHLAAAQ